MSRRSSQDFSAAAIGSLVIIFAVLAVYDYLVAATLEWQALALTLFLAGALLVPGMRKRREPRLLLSCLFLGALVILRMVELSPVKPFRSLFHDLQPGLSLTEVEARIQRHFSPNGRYRRPEERMLDDGSMLLILDPNDGRYNAATLHLAFREGRLLASKYSGD